MRRARIGKSERLAKQEADAHEREADGGGEVASIKFSNGVTGRMAEFTAQALKAGLTAARQIQGEKDEERREKHCKAREEIDSWQEAAENEDTEFR